MIDGLRTGFVIVEFWIDLNVVVEDVREVDKLFLDVITDETDLVTGAEQEFAFISSKTIEEESVEFLGEGEELPVF